MNVLSGAPFYPLNSELGSLDGVNFGPAVTAVAGFKPCLLLKKRVIPSKAGIRRL
ncbi:hypothetical protein GP5015_1711 [gamma proteobacterium HTCC5015]|nr:hypothetical protein GP5015_1711 [gamma proteobacterium HTCC5015]